MSKVVNLEDRRNNITVTYKDGDAMRAIVWAAGSEGSQELEQAIRDVLFKHDQESADQLRQLLGDCVMAYHRLGPGNG